MEKKIIAGVDEIDSVVAYIIEQMKDSSIVTFTGSLGAGKTTLIRKLLRKCGVDGVITSPTFTYVNHYKNNAGNYFYHFDCYRIEDVEDFCALGFDEYLYQDLSWSFIEWPEVINSLIAKKVCKVHIEYFGQDKRLFTIERV